MDKSVFIKYFSGNLSKDEEKMLLDWIDESESNRAMFLKERKLWDILLLNAPQTDREIYQETQTFQIKSNRWIVQLARIAAVFVIASGLSIWFTSEFYQNRNEGRINSVEVPFGQRTCLTLSDGTRVWLNAKTHFTFPENFGKNSRDVELDGEAMFDVVHDEKVPFIVHTSTYNVKVLGTRFNVYAYKTSNAFETTLLKGKVSLTKSNSSELPVELKPDEQFTYNAQTGNGAIKEVDTKEFVTWIDGIYTFNNQLFSSIISRLERYYETKIIVNDPELMNFRFTGKFRYSDPLTVILDVVKKSKPFRYRKEGNTIIIYN